MMNKLLRISLVFIASFFLISFQTHKYYFSLTDVAFNSKNKSLEIITNVFVDDIELELNKIYQVDLRLNSNLQYSKTDSLFSDYFSKKLKLKVDDKTCQFNYLGIEFDGDLVYVYQEVSGIENPKKFEFTNQILIQEFEDQQNVVKIKVGKTRKSEILSKKNVKSMLKF